MQHSDADPPVPVDRLGPGLSRDAEPGADSATSDPISSGPLHRGLSRERADSDFVPAREGADGHAGADGPDGFDFHGVSRVSSLDGFAPAAEHWPPEASPIEKSA